MTRRSKRELERAIASLDDDSRSDDAGFYHFQIGGDPDPDAGGYYRWNAELGVYVNDDGHELNPDEKPDGDFMYDIQWGEE